MTDDKPKPHPLEKVTAAVDEFMATVLRHLRTGQGSPLEELGLEKSREELRIGGQISQVREQNPDKHNIAREHQVRAYEPHHDCAILQVNLFVRTHSHDPNRVYSHAADRVERRG